MKRSTMVTIGALAVFGAYLLYSTLTSQKYSCTVSVTYQGRSGTATASAAVRARREAAGPDHGVRPDHRAA